MRPDRRRLAGNRRSSRRLLSFLAIPALLLVVLLPHYFASPHLPSSLSFSSKSSEVSSEAAVEPDDPWELTELPNQPIRVAILTAYPPEWHGIGEWVYDHVNRGLKRLCAKLEGKGDASQPCPLEIGIFAQDSGAGAQRYPAEVRFVIRRGVLEDYLRAAQHINADYDVLTIQHEFGMFGGPYIDDFLFAFWDNIKIPVNVNFHTVLGWGSKVPNVEFALHVREVLRRADHITHFMPQLCAFHHSLEPHVPCTHVPHGYESALPEAVHVDEPYRALLANRRIILSLGFITPDKGFSSMLRALPSVVKQVPSVLYLIVGGYAPGYSGDYLNKMRQEVEALNLTNHVLLLTNGNLQKSEVYEWFSLAEIVVAPHTWLHQVSSGTVTMAMGYGKAVVAASFPYTQDYMCDPTVPVMKPEIAQKGLPDEQVPPYFGYEPKDLSTPQPCWTVPYQDDGTPSWEALGRTVVALLSQPRLLEGTGKLALERVKGTTYEELAQRYIGIYRHMVRAGRRNEASYPHRTKAAQEYATSAVSPWSEAHSQRQLAAAAASLMPLAMPEEESPRQRPRTPRPWSTGLTLKSLVEALGTSSLRGEAADMLVSGQVVALVIGPFSQGPLLFSRWLAKAAAGGQGQVPRLVECTEAGHFLLDNGLLRLHGDLSIGKLMHSVPEPGYVLGYGLFYQVALVYSIDGKQYHADMDVLQGVRWGTSEREVWCEVNLLGEEDREVGKLRVTYSATAGSPVLRAQYEVTVKAGVQFAFAEVASKLHYGEAVPRHSSFHAFRGGGGGSARRVVTLAPVLSADDVIHDGEEKELRFDWDVLTDRNGDYPVFTFSPDMEKLRWVSYGKKAEDRSFLHVAHRYMLKDLKGGSTYSISESRVILSRADSSALPQYGILFDLRSSLLGFDLSLPKNSSGILEEIRSYANKETDAQQKDLLHRWLQRHRQTGTRYEGA